MFRMSGRVRKVLVAVLAALVVVVGLGLAVLPEIVRRVAESQAHKLAGRDLHARGRRSESLHRSPRAEGRARSSSPA